jgi:hypothetical protein
MIGVAGSSRSTQKKCFWQARIRELTPDPVAGTSKTVLGIERLPGMSQLLQHYQATSS